MTNEKNGTTTAKATETKTARIYCTREEYEGKDGKKYWAYLVKGTVRGREVKVDFAPQDMGGYEPLDIIFDVSDHPEIIMTEDTFTTESGKVKAYTEYEVKTVDEYGIEYACKVKPKRNSDTSLLAMLISTLKHLPQGKADGANEKKKNPA